MAIWSDANIKEARNLLKLRFDDAPFINTTIQAMQEALITDFGDDPEQVEPLCIAKMYTMYTFP